MLPGLALIRIGRRRSVWIPLPIVLLWPLWLLAWPVWALMWALRIPGHRHLWLLLVLSGRFSGVRLELSSRDGRHILFRLI